MKIRYVRQLTEDKAVGVMRDHPMLLKFVRGQTPEIAMEAVKADWRALRYVENRTPEMEAEAIRQDPEAAEMIKSLGDPKPRRGKDQAITYSQGLPEEDAIRLMTEMPRQFRFIKGHTPALCEAALKANAPRTVDHVPKRMMTPELKMIAAQAGLLDKIDDPTYEMCLASVRRDGFSVRYAGKEMRTPELLEAAIGQAPAALLCLDRSEKTPDLCMKAVMGNGEALQYVPPELQTEEMRLAAVKQDPANLAFASDLSEAVCMEAVRQSGNAIELIPEPSKDICLEAVRSNPNAIFCISWTHPSLESREDRLDVFIEAARGDVVTSVESDTFDWDMLEEAISIVESEDSGPRPK